MVHRITEYLAGTDKVRGCQRSALESFVDYRENDGTERAFLINLPTGAGKTGVISLIAHLCDEAKVLVVCHRKAVKDQLYREVSRNFFRKTLDDAEVGLKSTFRDKDFDRGDGIYITTFQKLAIIDEAALDKVQEDFDLIIVDEGHSEPSPVWREIIRKSKAIKVVVTATPYRNDLFELNVSLERFFVYTFKKACEDGVIVSPEFHVVRDDEVLAAVSGFLNENPGLKCIVKCKNLAEIHKYHDIFSADFITVSVHDRIENPGEGFKYQSVTQALKVEGIRIVIHQHKLDEGVDIPDAKLLVLSYALGSGRELVQSVGRVVRVYDNSLPLVLDMAAGANQGMWQGYLSFDDYISSDGGARDFIRSLSTSYLIEGFLNGFPQYSYFGGRFRRRLDLGQIEPLDDINIPMASVCFVQKNDDFSLQLLRDRLYWELHGSGALVKSYPEVGDMSVLIYVSFSSSRFFSEKLFFEPKLDVIVLKETNECLAVYDSGGRRYYSQDSYRLGPSLDINKLTALAASTPERRIKETHARAVGGLGRRPEMVALKGADLAGAQANQRNALYALSMLRFDNYGRDGKKSSSYYVGARSGRISDQLDNNFTLQDLSEWIDTVSDQMRRGGNVGRLIKSYAQPSKEPPAGMPASIILDFSDFPRSVQVRNGVIYPEFYYVEGGPVFHLVIDGDQIELELVYDHDRVEYSLELAGQSIGSADFERIVEYINDCGRLKVLFGDGTTYFMGRFYRIALPYEQGIAMEESWAGAVLFGLACLQDANLKEKGVSDGHGEYIHTTPGEFDPNSIFYLLDQLKRSGAPGISLSDLGEFGKHVPGCDLVVCTDMRTEPCDFIVSSPERLCFVHVKCGTTANPGAPAGALAEVGSQAIKNIHYLISNNDQVRPGNFGVWNDAWPNAGAGYPLSSRYRLYDGVASYPPAVDNSTSQNVWDLICERRKSLQCKKEIWIVTGRSFSRSEFIRIMNLGAGASSEVIQAYQLIESWVGAANEYGVELKIFTSV
ncbi:DEAD/DEAH box helicase [Pseudomonas aeruginosa]